MCTELNNQQNKMFTKQVGRNIFCMFKDQTKFN